MSSAISRVLYIQKDMIIIYLGPTLPLVSSNLPGALGGLSTLLFGLASDGVYTAMTVTSHAVGSYPAVSPLP